MHTRIELRELDRLNARRLGQLRRLRIPDRQVDYGGSFEQSLDDCIAGSPDCIRGLAILLESTPIGLVVLKRPPLSPAWASEDTVTLHGLKIDARWQGKGHGKAAFVRSLAVCRTIWPGAKRMALSVDADNAVALTLYKSLGMADSGPVFQGRIGLEHRLHIALD